MNKLVEGFWSAVRVAVLVTVSVIIFLTCSLKGCVSNITNTAEQAKPALGVPGEGR